MLPLFVTPPHKGLIFPLSSPLARPLLVNSLSVRSWSSIFRLRSSSTFPQLCSVSISSLSRFSPNLESIDHDVRSTLTASGEGRLQGFSWTSKHRAKAPESDDERWSSPTLTSFVKQATTPYLRACAPPGTIYPGTSSPSSSTLPPRRRRIARSRAMVVRLGWRGTGRWLACDSSARAGTSVSSSFLLKSLS